MLRSTEWWALLLNLHRSKPSHSSVFDSQLEISGHSSQPAPFQAYTGCRKPTGTAEGGLGVRDLCAHLGLLHSLPLYFPLETLGNVHLTAQLLLISI